jgi:superfamily II DNA helicase RecQ
MKRTTLILIFLALVLGGFVYFHEIKGAIQQEEVKENKQQIFSFTDDDVQSLTVKTKDITLNLESSGKSESPKWLIKSPISEPANDAIVSYLMDLLTKGKSEKTLSTPLNQLSEYGLDKPQTTIDIKLKNQQSHQLIIGKPNFNNSFLYAQIDPTDKINDNVNVLVVSKDFANAVNRELSEWKNIESQPLPGLPEPTPTNTK